MSVSEYHLSSGEIRSSHICGRQFSSYVRMKRFSIVFNRVSCNDRGGGNIGIRLAEN